VGYIKHDTIVCTAWDAKYVAPVHEKAVQLFGDLVSEIIEGKSNGQVSFFIAPDGSKEGWDVSDDCDVLRDQFLRYLKEANSFVDYVHVRFGGDDDNTQVYTGQYEERE
jgi:hypothetical protein